MKTPTKIWIDKHNNISEEKIVSSDTPYIRADLVDELVGVIDDYMNIVHSIEFEGIDERAVVALNNLSGIINNGEVDKKGEA